MPLVSKAASMRVLHIPQLPYTLKLAVSTLLFCAITAFVLKHKSTIDTNLKIVFIILKFKK
jgi:hypothetical protein